MFENFKKYARFTDRARKVMQLANQEAKRFNHEFIGTEHILLGLIKDGSGVAAHVLKNLDIDLRKIRLEVEKIVQSGPDMVIMGKLPQTPRAKNVIEIAIEEAKNLNHNYVGTEHLLLGLVREQEGVAAQVLINLGVTPIDLREEVLILLGHNKRGEKKSDESIVHLPHPLMCEANQAIGEEKNRSIPTGNDVLLAAERERIRSLEQQLWNVRIVLGALVGTLAGVLLFASIGAVIGLLLGGLVAALGWRTLGVLAGGGVVTLLACSYLPNEGGGLAGALLGALAGFLIADIGRSPDLRGVPFSQRRR